MLVLPKATSYQEGCSHQHTPAPTLQSVPRPLALACSRAELVPGAACTSGALPWNMGTLHCTAGISTCPS